MKAQHPTKAFYHTRNLFRRILRKAYGRARGGDMAHVIWMAATDPTYTDFEARKKYSNITNPLPQLIEGWKKETESHKAQLDSARPDAMRALESALRNGVINLRDYDRMIKLHNLARD